MSADPGTSGGPVRAGLSLVHDQLAGPGEENYPAVIDRYVDVPSFDRLVVLCFERSGERLLSELAPVIPDRMADVAIIEVGRQGRPGGDAEPAVSSNVVRGVSSSDDPDAILDAILDAIHGASSDSSSEPSLDPTIDAATASCASAGGGPGAPLFLVHSIAPYIATLDPATALEFVAELAYRIRTAGGCGVVWLDRTADEWLRAALSPPFDAVYVRSEDGLEDVTPHATPNRVAPDRTYDLLGTQRRRYLLHALATRREASPPLDALVSQLTRWLDDAGDERRVTLQIQHIDLPKLERAGVVEYDRTAQRVEARERFAALRSALHRAAASDFGAGAGSAVSAADFETDVD